jgi:hypothetical protein
VVAEVWEKLSVRTQAMQKFDMEKFSLKKPREVTAEGQSQDKISNRFENFENLGYDVDINWAWESVRLSKFQTKRV